MIPILKFHSFDMHVGFGGWAAGDDNASFLVPCKESGAGFFRFGGFTRNRTEWDRMRMYIYLHACIAAVVMSDIRSDRQNSQYTSTRYQI